MSEVIKNREGTYWIGADSESAAREFAAQFGAVVSSRWAGPGHYRSDVFIVDIAPTDKPRYTVERRHSGTEDGPLWYVITPNGSPHDNGGWLNREDAEHDAAHLNGEPCECGGSFERHDRDAGVLTDPAETRRRYFTPAQNAEHDAARITAEDRRAAGWETDKEKIAAKLETPEDRAQVRRDADIRESLDCDCGTVTGDSGRYVRHEPGEHADCTYDAIEGDDTYPDFPSADSADAAFNTAEIIAKCSADHDGADSRIVRFVIFAKPFEDGANVGEVELRYIHKGQWSPLDGACLIQPGRECGALYGLYRDGSLGLFAD